MSEPDTVEISETTLRCPVCGARQEWSDSCRRCKGDLALFRATAAAYFAGRRRCLAALAAGRHAEALDEARRCRELFPGEESARLVAACSLLCGEWDAAVAAAREE